MINASFQGISGLILILRKYGFESGNVGPGMMVIPWFFSTIPKTIEVFEL